MAFYGMHDAPGGGQLTNTFLNSDGMPLNVGGKKDFLVPWFFLNPFFEETLFRNGFLGNDGYCQNPNFTVLKQILQNDYDFLNESPVNKKWINVHGDNGYIQSILDSKNKLRQAYMAISMREGDYVYIRGKRGILNQGWLFRVGRSLDFKYKWFKNPGNGSEYYRQFFTLEAVCRVTPTLYDTLQARRASVWKLNDNDTESLKNLIN